MDDRAETLADVANDAREVDAVEVPLADSPADIDAETCEVLGGKVAAGGVLVPPVTTGALALLDLIDSPFVTGEEAHIQDVLAALYILHAGPGALDAVFASVRARRALAKCQGDALKAGVDVAESWFAATSAAAGGMARFDADVARFARGLGNFDLPGVTRELRAGLHRAISGFRMLPDGDAADGNQKKTVIASTPHGSRLSWPLRVLCWPFRPVLRFGRRH